MDVKNLNWLTYDITGKMKVLKQMNKTSTNSADLPRLFNDLPSKGGPDPFQLMRQSQLTVGSQSQSLLLQLNSNTLLSILIQLYMIAQGLRFKVIVNAALSISA